MSLNKLHQIKSSDNPIPFKGNRGEAVIVVDGHVDLTYFLMNHPEDVSLSGLEKGPFTREKIRKVGLRLFCNALYCEDKYNGKGSLQHLKHVLRFTLDHFDDIIIIKARNDLERLRNDPELVGTLFLLENADALAGDLQFIDELMDLGVRIVGLTHRGRNRIGDGDGVLIPEGLTPEGVEVIRALEDKGPIIDVAHLHADCFWKLLKVFNGPIICSHTGIRNICDIPRNIDLNQAKEIFSRDGLVGITFNPDMLLLDGEADLEHVFVHLDVLVQRFGPDGVAIGSDFCGFDRSARGLEDITKIPQLAGTLLAHGYDEEAVKKIMGLNWLRLYERLF